MWDEFYECKLHFGKRWERKSMIRYHFYNLLSFSEFLTWQYIIKSRGCGKSTETPILGLLNQPWGLWYHIRLKTEIVHGATNSLFIIVECVPWQKKKANAVIPMIIWSYLGITEGKSIELYRIWGGMPSICPLFTSL